MHLIPKASVAQPRLLTSLSARIADPEPSPSI